MLYFKLAARSAFPQLLHTLLCKRKIWWLHYDVIGKVFIAHFGKHSHPGSGCRLISALCRLFGH